VGEKGKKYKIFVSHTLSPKEKKREEEISASFSLSPS